ncbi:MAG: PQQ-dependent dehydrogenase, methanol/ethanol family [Gammaproteobacteria bacterium]
MLSKICASLCLITVAILLSFDIGAAPLDADLENDANEPNNVLTYGMGYNAQRFSSLSQINKTNINKLVPVWSLALESQRGEVGQPMVFDGVMYVANADWTVAIDAVTGIQLWRTPTYFNPDAAIAACCGVSNRGVALYNGLVIRGTIDAHLVALEQKTGKQVWKTKIADWKESYTITSAPLIANGVLITGMSGADFGTRGFIDGYDPMTGERLWRRHTTAGPDEPGGDTWKIKGAYKTGGASTWITGSFDPELDLVYWGTGNTGPWNPNFRGGDSLYAASVLALRPTTGEIAWYYQFTPNDMFDYDAVGEFILANLEINGKQRRVILQLNKNGFVYVLDRASGELLKANPYAKINWASHVDLKTGRPVETAVAASLRAGNNEILWPSFRGAKNWAHAAFNPHTGLLYANTIHLSSSYRISDPGPVKLGKWWIGATEFKFHYKKGTVHGHMEAIDPLTGKAKWSVPVQDRYHLSSMLATAAGLLFTGTHTREFIALDADTGDQLWEFRLSSGVNASPITWAYRNKQYVTVLSGLGGAAAGLVGNVGGGVPRGGAVWTFALSP